MKIIIVDDHELMCCGIRVEIKNILGDVDIYTSVNRKHTLELLEHNVFDLAILDYEMPECNALDLIEHIKENNPHCKILILTLHDESWIINSLIRQQVDGLVLKSDGLDCFRKAVLSIVKLDKPYFCTAVLDTLMAQAGHQKSKDSQKSRYTPTARELDILKLLAEGNTSKDISEILSITKNTVDTIRKNIISKSGTKNISQLIRISVERGWL